MDEDTIEIEKQMGDWIFKQNIKGTQTHNGVYYHYNEVCQLLKLMKQECEGKNSTKSTSNCNIPPVSNAVCGMCAKPFHRITESNLFCDDCWEKV